MVGSRLGPGKDQDLDQELDIIFISWFYDLGTWSFGSNDFDNISFYDTGFDNVDIENEIEKKDLFQDYDDGEIVASKSNAIKMDKYIQEVCT